MSTIDLIVLGILMQGARSAYELVHFIREHQLSRVLKISEPAVFKSCRRLAQGGYLEGETVRKPGTPDKVVYQLNDRGQERFYELMGHFSQQFKPFHLELNTVIWNIENLEREEASRLLLNLQQQLHQAREWVHAHELEMRGKLGFGPQQIVRQYCMTFNALAEWIDQTVEAFEAQS